MTANRDCWAEWVAQMRPDHQQTEHPHWRWREQILDNAEPVRDQTILDVGCGEGLIAFGALERGAGTVVFSDISRDLLDFCHARAADLGVLERCRFVRAHAEDLAAIDEESVDVVTTRSVLVYVHDKRTAFAEFARVLRLGGRISLFEPINRFARTNADTWAGYDLSAIPDISRKIRAVYDAIQPPDGDPMIDFDERDLIAFAEAAGFQPVHLHLEAEIRPHAPAAWDDFIGRVGNPRIPSLEHAMREALSEKERRALVAYLRPRVESSAGTYRMAVAFLHAARL